MNNKELKNVEAYLFDMDGTLYVGGKVIDGAIETLNYLRNQGKQVFFLTNNSSISVKDYHSKLIKFGLTDDFNEILSSSLSTIHYLKKNGLTKRVYLVGTESLKSEFIESGIELVSENPETVVLSYDKELTYQKLVDLTKYIVKGARYIATHEDINCPHPDVYLPDIGSFMALIEKSTGLVPEVICGKPRKAMGDFIKERLGLESEQIAMIGDRLMTDIAFGEVNNFVSILVLSGESTKKQLEASEHNPDFVMQNVHGIVDSLEKKI